MTDDKKDKNDNSIRIDRSHDNTTNNYTTNNYYNGTPRRPPSKKTLIGILIACIIVIIAVICVVGIVNTTSHSVTPQSIVNPTAVPTPSYTAKPTTTPTAVPTPSYTVQPTTTPTAVPTTSYTVQPTTTPTAVPTTSYTVQPTVTPTAAPTTSYTAKPTATPTIAPTVKSTPTPTPTPKRVTVGTLVINTNPRGANVYIDDVHKGITPTAGALTLSDLSEGTHTLKIECENYQTLTQEVNVVADDYTTLTLPLQLVENPVLRTDGEVADFFAGKMGSKAKLKSGKTFIGGKITASQPLTLDLMDATITPITIPSGSELTILSSPGIGKICEKSQGTFFSSTTASFKTPDMPREIYGFAVLVESGGKFTLKSGTISDNHGDVAYDAWEIGNSQLWGVINYGTFIMDGGDIVQNWLIESYEQGAYNSSESKCGGVYNQGTMIMNGGDISNNKHILALRTTGYWERLIANKSAGVVTSSTGFTMNGGTIHDNYPANLYYTDTGEKITTTVSK